MYIIISISLNIQKLLLLLLFIFKIQNIPSMFLLNGTEVIYEKSK
jgi:hypothetical protein